MAQKQSIFGRISQLAKANINALLDQAEDPQKMIDQMIRDYTNSIAEAESAVATTIGNLRMLEQDRAADAQAANEWLAKAKAASDRADQYRAAGDTANADRFDQLAKIALGKQMDAQKEVTTADPQIAAQTQVVDQLKTGLAQMKDKLSELKSKRDSLVARAKTAQAQTQVTSAVASIDILDPTSEISRFEDKVRRQEAQAQGQAEIAASSITAQFESLSANMDDLELENRLAALKAGTAPQAITAAPTTPAAGSTES